MPEKNEKCIYNSNANHNDKWQNSFLCWIVFFWDSAPTWRHFLPPFDFIKKFLFVNNFSPVYLCWVGTAEERQDDTDTRWARSTGGELPWRPIKIVSRLMMVTEMCKVQETVIQNLICEVTDPGLGLRHVLCNITQPDTVSVSNETLEITPPESPKLKYKRKTQQQSAAVELDQNANLQLAVDYLLKPLTVNLLVLKKSEENGKGHISSFGCVCVWET